MEHPLEPANDKLICRKLGKKDWVTRGADLEGPPTVTTVVVSGLRRLGSTSNSGGGSTEKNAPGPVLSTARVGLAVEI